MSIIKINAITVAADSGDELAKRFAARAGAVDSSDGFEWFELLRPVEGTEDYLVYTRWRDEESFQAWMASQSFGAGHAGAQGAPQGGPGAGGQGGPGGPGGGAPGAHGGPHQGGPAASGSQLWSFEVVQSAGPRG